MSKGWGEGQIDPAKKELPWKSPALLGSKIFMKKYEVMNKKNEKIQLKEELDYFLHIGIRSKLL